MLKNTIISIIAIFIAWAILDYVIHGMMLQQTYAATAQLWRPMDEMKVPLMYLVTLAYITCFVLIYAIFIRNKSLFTGVKFGALYGAAAGISMGFGSFSYMPIPLSLAFSWFAGMLVKSVIAGALAGLILKPK